MQKVRMVYLAGPIDLDPTNHKRDWRKEAAKMLKEENVCSFLPSEAFVWAEGTAGAEKVIRINAVALEESDAVLCHLNEHITIGTIREIEKAVHLQKPVVLWIDKKNDKKYEKSLYLAKIAKVDTLEKAVTVLHNTDCVDYLISSE